MKKIFLVVLAAFCGAGAIGLGVAHAQQKVDQGAPGRQGAWYHTAGKCAVVSPNDGGPVHQITQVGVASTVIPNVPTSGRLYVNVCSSAQNATSGVLVKCRADGMLPVFAVGNAGDVLQTGDCILYTEQPYNSDAGSTLNCITNIDAGNYLTTYECFGG